MASSECGLRQRSRRLVSQPHPSCHEQHGPLRLCARSQPARTGLKIHSTFLSESLSMRDPLPSDIVARLRSDSTAALAASLILAGSFPDIVSWALRAFSKSNEPEADVPADTGGKSRHAPRPQSASSQTRT